MRILSALVMLFVSGTALVAGFVAAATPLIGCYACSEVSGSNIDTGLALAFFAGLLGFFLALLLGKKPRRLACVELLVGAAGVVALVSTGLDSATYAWAEQGASTTYSTTRVDYLYVLWGIPTIVLLVAGTARWRAEAPQGDEVEFVVLPDGSLIVDHATRNAPVDSVAEAVECDHLTPPYRAKATRSGVGPWKVKAHPIDAVELPGLEGAELKLSVNEGSRTLGSGGDPNDSVLGPLDELAARKGIDNYVVQATRLNQDVWEARVSPL